MSLLASSRETSRSAFDRWASFYDRSFIINRFTRTWDEKVIDLRPATPLLDLGCATGRLVNKLSRLEYDDLYGFDISLECLRIARRNAGSSKISFTQGFIEYLPYKSNLFSTVILSGVFHHLENPLDAIREAARVLKRSGELIIMEPNFIYGIRQIVNLVLDFYPVQGDRRFYTPRKISDLVESSGFLRKLLIRIPLSYILVFERC